MDTINHSPITSDMLARIRGRQEVEGMRSKYIHCPNCHHLAVMIYEDAAGHIQCRCKKCGQESVYKLSFRLAYMPQFPA